MGVQEWLMRKSGFENFEVDSYKEGKLRVDTDKEREAFEAMERAKEVITRQFREIKMDYVRAIRWNITREIMIQSIEEKYRISAWDFDKLSELILKD